MYPQPTLRITPTTRRNTMKKDLHPVTGKPFFYTCMACKTRHFTQDTPTLADRNVTSFRAYYCALSQQSNVDRCHSCGTYVPRTGMRCTHCGNHPDLSIL